MTKPSTLRATIGALIEWDADLGRHEAPIWSRARAIYRATSDQRDIASTMLASLEAIKAEMQRAEGPGGLDGARDMVDAAIAAARKLGIKATGE